MFSKSQMYQGLDEDSEMALQHNFIGSDQCKVHSRRVWFISWIVLASLLLVLSGCRFPTDIEHTTQKVTGAVIKVGVTENPPWVVRTPDGPAGLEPEIILDLAEQFDAEVSWHWGTESELLAALKQYQLHLVVGGLTDSKHLRKLSALTKPYYRDRITVGFPSSMKAYPNKLKGIEVGVDTVNEISRPLRDRGAIPVPLYQPEEAGMPVAGPVWWLNAYGFEPGGWELLMKKHVFALPKGEHSWMMKVQKHLKSVKDIEQRLQGLEEAS